VITDTEIKVRGLKALADALGHVEAERFITLLMREPLLQWSFASRMGNDPKDL
jgi:hypothetical protein